MNSEWRSRLRAFSVSQGFKQEAKDTMNRNPTKSGKFSEPIPVKRYCQVDPGVIHSYPLSVSMSVPPNTNCCMRFVTRNHMSERFFFFLLVKSVYIYPRKIERVFGRPSWLTGGDSYNYSTCWWLLRIVPGARKKSPRKRKSAKWRER